MFVLASCAKDSGSNFPLDGAYAGEYQKTDTFSSSASVRLVFAGNGFSGETNSPDKTICAGNYDIFLDSISFTNLCSIPQDQLLVYGNYQMKKVGDSLYMRRDSTTLISYSELFSLRKQ